MKDIGKEFQIKDNKYGPPIIYLGAGILKFQLMNGSTCWSMDSKQYVQSVVETVHTLLEEDGRELKTGKQKNHIGPLPHDYRPELDSTNFCDEVHSSQYRQIIGIQRWAIELGQFDILLEVSLLLHYQANPHDGHLEALYLIINYLHNNKMKHIVFDPREIKMDESIFNSGADWKEFYGNVKEEDPPNIPMPLGAPVSITCFVDSNHAGNKITRCLHTGIIIFINNVLIQVFSKKQNTCESSTYGSKLVAMRIARDMVSALRIKLKCFGVPLRGPSNVLGDNSSVVKNMSIHESTLSKKHNSINYHIIREAVAAGIIQVAKEDGKTNLADPFTKLMLYSKKYKLLSGILLDR
jgi:hypothetical protein